MTNKYRVAIDSGLVVIDELYCTPDKVIRGAVSEKEKKLVTDLQPGQTAVVGDLKITRLE